MSGAMSGGMMVRLSKRMQALASMVTPGGVLADVGCDHGLLSVYLVKEGVVERAIATDLREGPLKRARESISAYCCQDRIETRLSDGLSALRPKEAEHILIAGMGGGIVLHILRDGEETARAAKELILQPQSEIYEVRRFLWEQGYRLMDEDMVEEDGKFYPMMKVSGQKTGRVCGGEKTSCAEGASAMETVSGAPAPTEEELLFGKLLLERRHPVLRRYLEREKAVHETLKASMERMEAPGERALLRKKEISRRLDVISRALERWNR